MTVTRTCLSLLLLLAPLSLAAQEPSAPPKEPPVPERAELEKRFSEKMANSVMIGFFTVDGQNDNGLKEERYEIESAKKMNGDLWIFTARIQYGENDVKVPVPVKVLWAGDTPMISLTDLTIPGLGTFTSRVLFYENRYAGTWQHGEVGGHLFGRIEKGEESED